MKKIALVLGIVFIMIVFLACGSSPDISGEQAQETEEQATIINEVNTDQIYFAVTGTLEEAFGGVVGFTAYMENKTDKTLLFSWTDTSVNGYMVDNWFGEEVAPGKKANTEIYFMSADMEDNNIKSVEEAEYTLWVYDAEDWGAEDVYKESFTIKVK